ncbi:hypothetical protein [Muricoccus vinaceus]|uniref:Uncharacterized protein n=1 Tax=Muricoccus vinaceus TaxID=424704 RepID=A0ABV6ILX5_9PROT
MTASPTFPDMTQEDPAVLATLVEDLARFAEGRGTAPLGAFLRDLADRLSSGRASPAP